MKIKILIKQYNDSTCYFLYNNLNNCIYYVIKFKYINNYYKYSRNIGKYNVSMHSELLLNKVFPNLTTTNISISFFNIIKIDKNIFEMFNDESLENVTLLIEILKQKSDVDKFIN